MCILCVIQKWSRRVATMLPWLVIPLIGLWALSQLLPPAFRFEITSPRLACVFVLLVTLFWYEILMPQLSAWRVRRNARLRERKRFEAIELQKLRKTATKRCRNCLTPYKDQNPAGGRFMCSCCGHISKRPVLDLPIPPGFPNSGIIKELVGKSGKLLNQKVWPDNGWMSGQDWLESGSWAGKSVAGKSSYWRQNGSSLCGGDEHCLAEKSYSGIVIFCCKLFTSFFLSIRWLWRKMFRISSSREDNLSDSEHRGILAKMGENGGNFPESRVEKARRKAEEKRQARLERELLEEEERKQREEVARLVEERRKLRDEKKGVVKDRDRTSQLFREKDGKKEAEKKCQERRKEKDKSSSKSNSDAEDLEKKTVKESERKQDLDKKSETDRRESQKLGPESAKGHSIVCHSVKNIPGNNFGRGYAGSRYLDRMRGTFLSSSKAFGSGSLFGKVYNGPASVVKDKSNGSVDHVNTSISNRDMSSERVIGKSALNGDDKNINHPVFTESQPVVAPKKSWQQLFTRSPSAPSSTIANVISRPVVKPSPDISNSQPSGQFIGPHLSTQVSGPQLPGQLSSTQSYDNPINFGLPSPFTIPTYPKGPGPTSSSLGFSPVIEPQFPRVAEGSHECMPEEPELFEDPCYIPDVVSLLGPVSESLDNFRLDLGAGFATEIGMERPRTLKTASSEINKPSPIESPLSREKHNCSNNFPSTPKALDLRSPPKDDTNANDKGTWQMWNSSPFGQDGLGLVGGPAGWILPSESNRLNKDEFFQPPQKTVPPAFIKEDQVLSGTLSSQNVLLGKGQSVGIFNPVMSCDHDPWLKKPFYPPLSRSENNFSVKHQDETVPNGMLYGSPSRSSTGHPFELPATSCWPKEWDAQGAGMCAGRPSVVKPPVGGLFPSPDVQSLWSFDMKTGN
ncbi:uncharacterized protein LOC111481413 [Cucurbita maxima]|uniref:Uncharacterized protein LOC111481413 n=1 Tax=Cucurbita maxima TaxID=3661 RepID=A0A6J1IZQ4_CUCMA|nr:uncharacterized protein LOC111481413 [Cucurbita maxima]XP_022982581.1 uncharacterized protein LOC111481413 [Cucurbita maxima]